MGGGCGLKQEAADIPIDSFDTQTNLGDNLTAQPNFSTYRVPRSFFF